MSHFTECETEFKVGNEDEMMKALEKVFGKGNVELHPAGAPLLGYKGDDRSKLQRSNPNWAPPCEFVIRRENVGGSSNDVGFAKQKDGTYKGYVSEFDMQHNFGPDKQGKVNGEYNLLVSEKVLRSEGWSGLHRVENKDGTTSLKGKLVQTGIGSGAGGWGGELKY